MGNQNQYVRPVGDMGSTILNRKITYLSLVEMHGKRDQVACKAAKNFASFLPDLQAAEAKNQLDMDTGRKDATGGAKESQNSMATWVTCLPEPPTPTQTPTKDCLKLPLLDACGNIPGADQESSNLFEALLIHHASCHGATSKAHPSR